MSTPLADRLRPRKIEDIVGQDRLLGEGGPLRNIIESGEIPNMIFYGPPGVGKTTLARIVAQRTRKSLETLNGTTAGTADIKRAAAKTNTLEAPDGVLLYLDEIQYFNKKQQQTLLEYIENGAITLIASTTENPYFYVYGSILSRSTVFEFKSVSAADTEKAVLRAFEFLEKEKGEKFEIEAGVVSHMAASAGGDVRKAINAAELSVLSANRENGKKRVTLENVRLLSQRSALRYDREGDEHYDIISAYQKSLRGSDPDAALHYLARLLQAGDLISACRRLLVCACEDVGLAYPQIIPIVKAATDSAAALGLPEARIPLADATVLTAVSPKSNSAYNAINKAMADVAAGETGPIPRALQNMHFDGEDNPNKGQFYKYAHDFPNHWVEQRYLPDAIGDKKYYEYGDNKNERAAKEYWESVKKNG